MGRPDVVAEEARELGLEGRVAARGRVRLLQLAEGLHERLRDVAPAVGAEVAARVGPDARVPCHVRAHARPPSPPTDSPPAPPPRTPAPGRVLAAGSRLHAARHVDPCGPHGFDRGVHVRRGRARPRASGSGTRSARRRARATSRTRGPVPPGAPGPGCRGGGRPPAPRNAARPPARSPSPTRTALSARRGRPPRASGGSSPCSWSRSRPDRVRDPRHLVPGRVDEDADPHHEGRQGRADRPRPLDRHRARALRPEDEADRVGARLGGGHAVVRRRDPADLDEEAGHRGSPVESSAATRSWRSASPGSGAAMRCSPTRKASKPASRRRRTSAPAADAALRHRHHVVRDGRGEGEGRVERDGERPQVAVVHPDDPRPRRERAIELRPVVHLDERVDARLARHREEAARARRR